MLMEGSEPQLFCFAVFFFFSFCHPVIMSVMSAFIRVIASRCQTLKRKDSAEPRGESSCQHFPCFRGVIIEPRQMISTRIINLST